MVQEVAQDAAPHTVQRRIKKQVSNSGQKTAAVLPNRWMRKNEMNKIKTLLKNKYVGYLLDLAVVFCAVAILSSGTNFVIDHRVFVLVLLLAVLAIRGIC